MTSDFSAFAALLYLLLVSGVVVAASRVIDELDRHGWLDPDPQPWQTRSHVRVVPPDDDETS